MENSNQDGGEVLGFGAPASPSVVYCEALLAAVVPLQICQLIADEIASATGADWSAVLRVTPEARAFEVAGSIGPVPSVLHGCHNMTPVELAAALGWRPGLAPAQLATGSSPLMRGLARPGGATAYCLLPGDDAARGLALVGWTAAAAPARDTPQTLLAVATVGAAALRHADRVADLRVSERTKSEFVATMSHELRNPLSAIIGYTDLLLHGDFGPLGAEQQDVLHRAHRGASSLLDLINATLDVSRFEVGDRVDQTSTVDLTAILREQIEELRAAGRDDDLRIRVDAAGDLMLASDPLKIRVAVRQLVEAAAAVNQGAALLLNAHSLEAACVVDVAPDGMSQPPRDVFAPVELPEDGNTSAVPFALFVAHRLVEILGGRVEERRQGESVAYRVWLPRG